jgi:hypothetical protein
LCESIHSPEGKFDLGQGLPGPLRGLISSVMNRPIVHSIGALA